MIRTTKAQRSALKREWKRWYPVDPYDGKPDPRKQPTYREFRKRVQPCFDKSGCIMVAVPGMWLGIETDGYTHS